MQTHGVKIMVLDVELKMCWFYVAWNEKNMAALSELKFYYKFPGDTMVIEIQQTTF